MSQLRGYQADLMAGVHDAWKSGARRVAAVMATGGGKGHPLDTEVPTPDGLRLWGELRPGDRVFGSDGSSVEVTAVYDRGALPTFRVRMSDGSSVLVDGEHLWRVRDAQDRKSKTLTTQQLIDGGMRPVRGGGRGYRWHVPMAGAVARARADLPLDPYVVGALIANGSMTGRHTQLTTADPEVAKLISAVTSVKKVNDATDGVCDRYYLAGLTSVTQCLGMRVYSYEKRVPRAYLESSRDQRIALLHGLMDGDGTARDVTRRSVEYSTTSPGLAEDVRELVTSLGGTANLSVSVREGKRDEYQVGVLMPSGINPFQLARKAQAGVQSKRQMQPRRAIVSIERVEDRPIRCISVDADDHLYLITRHHIVTHNTHVFSHLAEQCRQRGKPTLVLAHRTELIDQAIAKLRKVAVGADIGRMQGPIKQWRHDIVVGSVQTCSRDGALRLLRARRWGLVIIDECHHSASPSYQKVLQAAGCFRADGPVLLGVTATLDRSDGLSLGDTFEAVAEPRIGLIDLIKQGYLVRPRGIRVKIRDLDLDSVKRVAGDLNQGQLGAAMHAAMAPQKLVEAWIEHAKGRPTIAFMPTVAVSEEVAATFREAGFPFAHLSDKTHPRERAATLEAFRRGEIVGLCNVGLFTEGTDLPTTSCVILKMTSSSTLYQQMVGRGLRLHDPAQCECPIQPCEFGVKSDCIILDPSGVAKRHTLATLASLTGAPAEGEVPDDLLMYEEDLEEEPEREESPDVAPIEYEDGDALDHELFDLFGESSTTWLRTPGGVWFVPVPDGLIYLSRDDLEYWSACWRSEQHGYGVIDGALTSIEDAMRAGEEYIAARPMWQADRSAPWRSMRAWGSNRTKGEIADEKAMRRAAALLDS